MTDGVDTGGGAGIGGDVAAGGDFAGRDLYKLTVNGPASTPAPDPAVYLRTLLDHSGDAPAACCYVPLAGSVIPEAEALAPELTLFETFGEGAQRQVTRVRLTDIREAVQRHAAWVLLGEPGSGKTTSLQRLLIDLARERLAAGAGPVPLLLPLAGYHQGYASPHAFLAEVWRRRLGREDLEARLRAGEVFLLVDALNEMPFSNAADYRARVDAWGRFAREEWPGNRVVFTCRGRDYSASLGLPQVLIERLDDARVRAFLDGCLSAALAATAWERLAAGPLLELVRNPLYLSILCRLVQEGAAWPGGRADLFRGFVSRRLTAEGTRNHLDWPGEAALVGALATLAQGMQRLGEGTRLPRKQALGRLPTRVQTPRGEVDLDPESVVRLGLAATLLDTEPDPETGVPDALIRFYHHQFQEFFAAHALLEARRGGRDPGDDWRAPRLKSEMPDPGPLRDDEPLPPPPGTGWEEPTLMAAGLARDPGPLIAAVRAHNPVLAARCLAEAGVAVAPSEVAATRAALLADLENPRVHLRARIAAGEALGRAGDPRFTAIEVAGARVLLPPLVEIPAGVVRMGSSWWEVWRLGRQGFPAADERPRHRVRLPAFRIGRYPVTNAEYGCFIADGGYADERWWDTGQARAWRRGELKSGVVDEWLDTWRAVKADPGLMKRLGWSPYNIAQWTKAIGLDEPEFRAMAAKQTADRPMDRPAFWTDERYANPAQPVVGVNWFEARAYCRWLTERWRAAGAVGRPLPAGALVRLPTEAEWERVARLGSGRRFPWGNRWDPDLANTAEGRVLGTTPVGAYPRGASPGGVQDLAGNCWEWCASRYLDYPIRPGDGRDDPEAEGRRVLRGASWVNERRNARTAYRYRNVPDYFSGGVGLRVVLSLADSGF